MWTVAANSASCLAGCPIGAEEALRLITKGPGPPRRGDSCSGCSRSSMLRCQISPPVNGVFIDAAISHPAEVGCWRRYWRSSTNETVMRVYGCLQKCELDLCQRQRCLVGLVGRRLQALDRPATRNAPLRVRSLCSRYLYNSGGAP